jgi:hypothetical protein
LVAEQIRLLKAMYPSFGPITLSALRMLSGYPHVFWRDGPDAPLRRVDLRMADLEIEARRNAAGEIEFEPRVGDDVRLAPDLRGVVAGSIEEAPVVHDPKTGVCWVLSWTPAQQRFLSRVPSGFAFPPESHATLVSRLSLASEALRVRFPQDLAPEAVDVRATFVLSLEPNGEGIEGTLLAQLPPDHRRVVPGSGDAYSIQSVDGRVCTYTRDLDGERSLAKGLVAALGQDAERVQRAGFRMTAPDAPSALALVESLRTSAPVDLVVEWPRGQWVVHEATSADVRVEVTAKKDWFGLEGGVHVEGARGPRAALRRGAERAHVRARRRPRVPQALRRASQADPRRE